MEYLLEWPSMSFSFVLLFENPYSVKIVSIPFDKLMLAYVVVTAVAAIAAVVTLLTIRGQLQVMRGQLRQMEETGKQTESLIAQASAQSNALLIAARAAESNAAAAHAQVVQFRAVAEAAEKSANAAVRNAEALINSERPWIFPRILVNIIGTDTNAEIIVPNSIDFNLINLGRTPGELIAVSGSHTFQTIQDTPTFDPAMFPRCKKELTHRRILAPDEAWNSFHFLDGRKVLAEANKAVFSTHRLIVFGSANYRDTLGGADSPIRESRFCYYFDPVTRDLEMCGVKGANAHI
jgi:hypothetical protein